MSFISILIVDDDINKITSIITAIKEEVTETLSINQASCVQEAIEYLQRKEFHLLITDLKMPIKHDSSPDDSGGESLVRSLYKRRTKANVPMYIIGLTQFIELKKDLKNVWNVWYYDASEEKWKDSLRDLIFHISLVKSRINVEKIETLFVEGTTDKKIIEFTISKFYPDKQKLLFIDTIKYGGGASWVERQLFIWGKQLAIKPNDKQYLKAIGLFDDDKAGKDSIDKLRSLIDINSAESKTFLIRKCSAKYSPILKSIKKKGITFPTVIEDLLSESIWEQAKTNGWLEKRDLTKLVFDDTKISISIKKDITEKELEKLGFTNLESLIILYKIDDDYKKTFANLILEFEKESLMPMKYLVDDFFESLNL